MKELKIIDILDKHNIAWSWMGDCVYVGNHSKDKIDVITSELLTVKGCRQGFDKNGNYIAFAK